MDPKMDSSNPMRAHSSDLLQWAKALEYTELSRWKHPGVWAYSCFSAAHESGYRIELPFGNTRAMSALADISYLPSGLSDHAPLELCIKLRDAGC